MEKISEMATSKSDMLGMIERVFEMADDKLLENNGWCKHSCLEERNLMHDIRWKLVDLVNDYYNLNDNV